MEVPYIRYFFIRITKTRDPNIGGGGMFYIRDWDYMWIGCTKSFNLGYNKYFEHIQYINSILGIKPPVMDEELIETLCVLFIEIQQPWAIFCPLTRTNFFNYTYILCQLCVLLDQHQYLPFIPMMKDRIKQLEQDMIWKQVCEYLDWEYYPTV